MANDDHGGITLLNPADKKGTIFFADKDDNDVGSIKYNHADNSLAFHTNGATASLELDSSQNVKVNGGLGVGGVISDSAGTLTVQQPASNQSGGAAIKAIGTAYSRNKVIHAYMDTGNASKSLLYAEAGSSVGVVMNVAGDGNVYFPSGNVAIGATTSTRALLVNATSNTKVVLQEGGAGKGLPLIQISEPTSSY